ncbi:inactive phospholipase C-like protein 2 [Clytia hemisphaerica]|uniref:Phosphoinositide phospholipase C n=1 Tax=Clytia hemisphaerica TaxID=252671 RepID=A0A7M5WR66_9CNID
MASKGSPITSSNYQQKLESIKENGIINEVANDPEDREDVFQTDAESETKSTSSSESSASNIVETSTMNRKKSVLKRGGGEQRTKPLLQKRVSFSSVPSERRRRVSSAADCFTYMQSGTEFLKLRPGGRQYQRFYQLDQDMLLLHWRPSSKKPEKAILPVDLLYEIRTGKNTTVFKEQGMSYNEDCCFSLIVGPNYDSIDLVATSSDEANIWITGLRLLNQKSGMLYVRSGSVGSQDSVDGNTPEEDDQQKDVDMRERWLRQQFRLADKEHIGYINDKALFTLLKKLRTNAPQQMVKQKFKEYATHSSLEGGTYISEDDFYQLFIDLTTRQEIYFLLVKYSSNGLFMTTDDLLLFLETEQGITWAGKEYSLEIINRCEPSEECRKKQVLGLDGLTKYFSEKDCHIFEPNHFNVCEDMKKPLSHYFIASSHNTYLLDDQLRGRSSIQGYINCLQQGCRCVELDCWDGPNNEPIIYHGHTLTTKILFLDVILTIREYAFLTSDYPLILSIENHCSVKQQEVMAQHLKKVFAETLYKTPANESLSYLPSPESLKGKVIVKNKKLPRSSSGSTSELGDVSEEEEEGRRTVTSHFADMTSSQQNGSPSTNKSEGNVNDTGAFENVDNCCAEEDDEVYIKTKSPQKFGRSMSTDANLSQSGKLMKLAPDLSDLVNLCKSVRFQSFQHSFERQKYWEICSIGETTGRKLCQTCPEEFVSYTKKFLSRIYPAAKRVDSSNYNPVEFWNCGCQLVSLNYQYSGLAMDLNRGRFLKNGQCGYALKPGVMRDEVAYFSPTMKHEIPGVSPLTLQIKIISGTQLPKPRGSTSKGDALDPYVMVELYGLAADCHYERSRTIPHNGYNPVFDETFEFRVILPELALLRFVVLDDDHIGDCFIGQCTIPLECIRQGYRTVYLLSATGEDLAPASLFVHVSFLREDEITVKNKGFSIAKSLRKKEFTSLRSLGMKVIDDTFKLSINPLREATTLRENYQNSLNNFKDCCGLTPRNNIKQCMRILLNRIQTAIEATPTLKCSIDISKEFPSVYSEGEIPPIVNKALNAFEQLVSESQTISNLTGDVYERLTHARRSAFEWHGDLRKKCQQENFKDRRTNKVIENFSWNIKILCGQADLLKTTKQRCDESLKQIKDVIRVSQTTSNENKEAGT